MSAQPKTTPPLINGLRDVIHQYDVFFLDVWGVLYDGFKPYDGVIEALEYLKKNDKTILLLSNSPCASPQVARDKMTPMGITPAHYDIFLTSGDISQEYMQQNHQGQKVYTFWDDENPSALENTNTTRVMDVREADFIYASLLPRPTPNINVYKDVLALAYERDLPFVCGNPDRVVGYGGDIYYCVGTLAEIYESMGGTVIWYGKPYIDVYNRAWDMVGKPDKSRILAIGDSLITDVAGATNFGCDVLWNVTGIHWEELQQQNASDKIDFARVQTALNGHSIPTGLLQGFKV